MSLARRIALVNEKIATAAQQASRKPPGVTLVAATKVQTSDTIRQAIAASVTICGENQVQEMTAHLDDNACAGAAFHSVGHLQTSKARQVMGRVGLIESMGSGHLLKAIEARAAKLELVQGILLEVNINGEAPKSGISPEELSVLAAQAVGNPHTRLRRFMAILPVAVEPDGNRPSFAKIRQLYVDIRSQMDDNKTSFDCLSMGMNGDFEDIVREGATPIRVDTALFGLHSPMHKGWNKFGKLPKWDF